MADTDIQFDVYVLQEFGKMLSIKQNKKKLKKTMTSGSVAKNLIRH